MPEPDYYAALELTPAATPAQVRAAYRRLARAVHPDVNPDASSPARFALLQQAYEVLSEPDRRRRYDESRRGPGGQVTPGTPHYSWTNIASRTQRVGDAEDDLDDLYDTFFRGPPGGDKPG